jgi:hypothetical protein
MKQDNQRKQQKNLLWMCTTGKFHEYLQMNGILFKTMPEPILNKKF